jgi:photosystem II stability/assembly factor-like uncharacterized protein
MSRFFAASLYILVLSVCAIAALAREQPVAPPKPGEAQKEEPARLKLAEAEKEDTEAPKPGGGPEEFKYLKFRSIGPDVGGRVSRSTGVSGDALTYYAGTASGGVWKSSDGGYTWKSVFDDEPIASIGSLAVAPSDPNVVYVGSGEANIRGNVAPGNGIYKTVDGGKTWKHVWRQEGQIGTMIVHPANADIAFAAVLGKAFGPNPERGVYRTRDGGKTWQQVLFKDADTGASDVCFDPSNPHILFAGLWQARRRPWELTSGGPGSGLYMSHDGGDTWIRLSGKGLPSGIWGKVSVAVAPSDGKRVYAMTEAEHGGLFRSDDGGEKWSLASGGHYLRQRAWYFSTITVDPKNPDVVWCPQVRMLKSIDGGKSFRQVKGPHHGDHHDLWIDPREPQRMIDSNDGGVDISLNGGKNWFTPPLAIAQFYHVAVDNRNPYHVSGAMQDLGTASGPSNSLCVTGITRGDWRDIGGGEAGFTAPDPSDPTIIYAGEYGGYISRYDDRTRQARNMSIYPTNPSGHGAEDLRYRFQWTAPIVASVHHPRTLYHGANVLFKSTDGGSHWMAISPDLTRNDKNKQKWSGGPISGDNTGVEYYGTIFAIAESPRDKELLWVGSDDGRVHLSRDGGKNWTDVTPNMQGFPDWGTVSCIESSPFEAGSAYVTVDAHRMGDNHPYLFKTSDYGHTWKSLAGKLPQQDVYLHAIREDPKKRGMLYAGTELGLAFSSDDGNTWKRLKLNFPTVAVHDLVVKNNDLVVGTHGRSIWILDDLTPLRQMTPQIGEDKAHLFPPEPVTRWRYHAGFHHKGLGQNPPQGAIINYYLKNKPAGEITLEILDPQGGRVTKLSSIKEPPPFPEDDPDASEEAYKKAVLTTHEGVNRIAWDLRYQGADRIKGAKADTGDAALGPMVSPGEYMLKLTVDGKTQSASFVVNPDPRIPISPADLTEPIRFALTLRDDINHIVRMVHELRSLREQLTARSELLKDVPKAAPLIKQAHDLIGKINTLEEALHNPKAEVSYDILAQPGGAKLYSKYIPLFEWIHNSDGPVTQGMHDVYDENARELHALASQFDNLVSGDLAKFNDAAKRMEIPDIIRRQPLTTPKSQPEKARAGSAHRN